LDNVVSDGDDGGHDYQSELLGELGVGRENLHDKFKLMRWVRETDNNCLLLPYLTRFNSAERVVSVRDEFKLALLAAGDAH
jgi:hypothetical protein